MSLTHLCRRSVNILRAHPAVIIIATVVATILYGCLKSHPVAPTLPGTATTTESSGEDFLISALDEIESILMSTRRRTPHAGEPL